MNYDFSSIQFNLYPPISQSIFDFSNEIPKDFLINDKSRVAINDYHITVLYGLTSEDGNEVLNKLGKIFTKNIDVELGQIKKFVKDDHDILYLEAKTNTELESLRKFILNNFDNVNEYPHFIPHITIAYVKKNSCDHLLGDKRFDKISMRFWRLDFSGKNGLKFSIYAGRDNTIYPLSEEATTVAPTSVETGQHQTKLGSVVKRQFKKKINDVLSGKSKVTNKVKGGLADNKSPHGMDEAELEMGIKHEMEHTEDPDIALEIAMDHLAEDPKYYTKLKRGFKKNA